MAKLSVVISAYNEEKKIAACLASVAFADEIIVVDNESSDKTAEIAKKHGAKVFTRENNLMLNVNKNFGFSKATHEWILNLDADERVSKELQEEILSALESPGDTEGFIIPRKNIIFGKWMEHTGWYPDYHLRLFRKGSGKFAEEHVHEKIVIKTQAKTLEHPIVHENYRTVKEFLHKTFFIYAPNEAEQLLKHGYRFSYADAIAFPLKEFLGRFFAREGYKDGFHGLMLSLLMAFYHLIVFMYLWERQKFVDEIKDSRIFFDDEAARVKRELKHWVYVSKIANTKNPVTKSFLRLRRRM